MYYVKKIVQLILLGGIIWLSVENFSVKVAGMSVFGRELIELSVIFVIFASMILGALISAFFSTIKEWQNVRENKKKFNEMKNTIKDLELKNKDYQLAVNELEKMKVENSSLKSEVKTLKEVITPAGISGNKQVEY
ncbi:MAG: LapA family protein [Candidatus Delongbacteria bacterium]|nr:LapA family protein [Candidatus Delongbacteria bacterium]